MKTGKGRPGARVLVVRRRGRSCSRRDRRRRRAAADWEHAARRRTSACTYLVLDGPHVAGSGLGVPEQGRAGAHCPRLHLHRPAGLPARAEGRASAAWCARSQDGPVRQRAQGRLSPRGDRQPGPADRRAAGHALGLRHLPRDAAARPRRRRWAPTACGSTSRARAISRAASRSSRTSSSRSTWRFDLKKTVYFRGETVEADLVAQVPVRCARVANRPIAVSLPDGRILHGTTDAAGKFHVEFPTEGFAEEQALRSSARLPQDNVGRRGRRDARDPGFRHRPEHDAATSTSTASRFQLQVNTTDAQGEPIGPAALGGAGQAGQPGRPVTEREVAAQDRRRPTPRRAQASVTFRIDDTQGGHYVHPRRRDRPVRQPDRGRPAF